MDCDHDKLDDFTNNLKGFNLYVIAYSCTPAVSVMALSRFTVLCFRHYVTVDKSNHFGNCSHEMFQICGTICPLSTCTLCPDALLCHILKAFSSTCCEEPLNVYCQDGNFHIAKIWKLLVANSNFTNLRKNGQDNSFNFTLLVIPVHPCLSYMNSGQAWQKSKGWPAHMECM